MALANSGNHTLLIGALLLAIGIGIQNIPEGAVVALPIKVVFFLFFVLSRSHIFSYSR